jgi:pimeloyl-ACP methyl ester carboxylesterase
MFRCFFLAAALLVGGAAGRAETFQYAPETTIGYDVQGNGEIPVLLVHGLAASKEAWDLLTPGLLEVCKCTVYRMDLRGHGESSAPDDFLYSVVENAKIVRAFIADHKLRGVILVGHSYGGAVALQTALDAKTDDPGSIRALMLMSTPGVKQRFSFIVAHHKYETYGAVIDRVMPSRVRALIVVHAANPRFSEGTKMRVNLYTRLWKDRARTRAARRTARQFLDGGGLNQLAERDHETGIPTLVIAGTRDHLVRLRRAKELAASIPGARIEILKAGHAMQEDAPQRVVPVMAKFLNEVVPISDQEPRLPTTLESPAVAR